MFVLTGHLKNMEEKRTSYETHLRAIVNPDNVGDLTRKTARSKLEKAMGVDEGALQDDKEIINEILANIVNDIGKSVEEPKTAPTDEMAATPDKSAVVESQSESEADTRRGTRRRRVEDPDESATEESESESEDDSARRKRTPKSTPKKRKCAAPPMTKADFLKDAPSIKLKINENDYVIPARQFKTGSCGWGFNGKLQFKVGEHTLTAQSGLNFIVTGSGKWDEEKKRR
eukprot:GHVO01018479.1.p1 GENE.GHVO01018479.1~~GHVO01018479.1.p1  ORF type:complete len:230 (+),score=45.69 GHVO01018479.1:538-1227(+)